MKLFLENTEVSKKMHHYTKEVYSHGIYLLWEPKAYVLSSESVIIMYKENYKVYLKQYKKQTWYESWFKFLKLYFVDSGIEPWIPTQLVVCLWRLWNL